MTMDEKVRLNKARRWAYRKRLKLTKERALDGVPVTFKLHDGKKLFASVGTIEEVETALLALAVL